MKKTAIAVAALTLTCAASAQVTLSGQFGFGFAKAQPAPSVTSPLTAGVNGMQMTDGEVTFKAAEDLGGGFKATAQATMAVLGRDAAVKSKDATIALLTPIGQITAGAVNTESSQPLAFADTKIALRSDDRESGGDNIDVIAFTTMLGPVYATLSYAEAGTKDVLDLATMLGGQKVPLPSPPFPAGITVPLLQGGTTANLSPGGPGAGAGPVQIVGLNLSYANGPLAFSGYVNSYSVALSSVTDRAAAALFRSAYDGRMDTMVAASYDMGMAKVGLGYTSRNLGWANTIKAGVSVPIGVLTLGMTFEQKGDDSKSLGDGVTAGQGASGAFTGKGNPMSPNIGDLLPTLIAADLKGSAKRTKIRVGVDYALSKSTSINLSYGQYELGTPERAMTGLGVAQPGNVTTNDHQLRLMKTF